MTVESPDTRGVSFVPPRPLALGFVPGSIGQRVEALAAPESSGRPAARIRGRFFASCTAIAVAVSGCASLPERPPPPVEHAAAPALAGPLHDYGARIEASLGAGATAHWLLERADAALNARLALADAAAGTLDVQYFVWQNDASGSLLALRLLAAADRGVRVRLLLDDFGVSKSGAMVAWLDSHRGIEVRVFNPWASRDSLVGLTLEFLARTKTLNRRMHNKTFIADGRFAILGGRNVGDRYFGLYEPFVEDDLDVLVAGALVADVTASFDEFWNSPATYPVALLAPAQKPVDAAAAEAQFAANVAAAGPRLAAFPTRAADWTGFFEGLLTTYAAGPAELYRDSPNVPGSDGAEPHADSPELANPARARLYPRFKALVASAQHEVLISSPYFVPDAEFRELIAALVARGVRVAIATNSLASNNHVVAHTGYKRWRREVLRAGAELYELRVDAAALREYVTPPTTSRALGLHAKAVVVDRRRAFIGSANVDPRSMQINTEIGVAADSEDLARELAALLERDMAPENAWRVTMDADGWLTWSSGTERRTRQPATGFTQRAEEFLLNLLPLKDQL
jgi:putative cardiolipin synthase